MGKTMEEGREGAIFDAAFTVFTRYGFQRCTMDDIAREAGMSRPALYQYFRNKKAIYRGLVKRLADGMEQGIAAGLQRPGPLAKVLTETYDMAVIAPLASLMDTPHGPDLVAMHGDLAEGMMDDLRVRKHALLAAFFAQRTGADAGTVSDLADLVIDAFEGAKMRCADIAALQAAFGKSVILIAEAAQNSA